MVNKIGCYINSDEAIKSVIIKNMTPSIIKYAKIINILLTTRPIPTVQFLNTLKLKGIVKTFEMQSSVDMAQDPHVQIYLQIVQGAFGAAEQTFVSEDIWKIVEYLEVSADSFIKICERRIKNEKIS